MAGKKIYEYVGISFIKSPTDNFFKRRGKNEKGITGRHWLSFFFPLKFQGERMGEGEGLLMIDEEIERGNVDDPEKQKR